MRTVARFAAALLALLTVACGKGLAEPELRDGDLIFQTSKSSQSLAIQHATGSPYSHMGLIVFQGGEPLVFEAAGTVSYTKLADFIARGEGGHYVVKRLRDRDAQLTPEALQRAKRLLRGFAGKAYDLTFEWSDGRMYCSELVWKVYDRAAHVQIGELQQLRAFDLGDPLVKRKLHERYGDRIPLEEPVISPGAMFDSPLLETVVER